MSGEVVLRADLLAAMEKAGALGPTRLDLTMRPDLSFEQFEAIVALVGRVASAARWWAGDALLFGERAYGEAATAQASEALSMSPEGRMDCLRVASAWPPEMRRANLSFGHHRTLAARWLEPTRRYELLDEAEREGWSVRELEARVRELRVLDSGRHVTATDDCDELADAAAASLREHLITNCGHDSGIAVEVRIVHGGIDSRIGWADGK